MRFRITWEIDIESKDPVESARKALEIQRDPSSLATVFDYADEAGRAGRIDLALDGEELKELIRAYRKERRSCHDDHDQRTG